MYRFQNRVRSALGLGIIVLTCGCLSVPELDVVLTDVDVLPSTALEQRLALSLRVLNDSDQAIEATGVSLTLNVNGGRLARGVSSEAFVVPRLGEAEVSVTTSVSVFDALRRALSVAGTTSVSYELRGKIYTEGIRYLSFRRTGEFSESSLHSLNALSVTPESATPAR